MIYSLITWRQPDIRVPYHRYLAGITEDALKIRIQKYLLKQRPNPMPEPAGRSQTVCPAAIYIQTEFTKG